MDHLSLLNTKSLSLSMTLTLGNTLSITTQLTGVVRSPIDMVVTAWLVYCTRLSLLLVPVSSSSCLSPNDGSLLGDIKPVLLIDCVLLLKQCWVHLFMRWAHWQPSCAGFQCWTDAYKTLWNNSLVLLPYSLKICLCIGKLDFALLLVLTILLVYTWYMGKQAPIYRAGKAVENDVWFWFIRMSQQIPRWLVVERNLFVWSPHCCFVTIA
jgi:hypothetical protein